MLIFFVRHGLTDWNRDRRFQGTCDIPLNEDGLRQARVAAQRCRELMPERVYHSTLLRAAKTAQTVGEACGAPLVPHEGFNEVCMGLFQGLNHAQAKEKFPEGYARYFADSIHTAPPEGESLAQLQGRALRALEFVERDAQGCGRVCVVSHGALLKTLLAAVAGIPLQSFSKFDVSNCSISVIESQNGVRRLITLNSMAHFGDPYAEMSQTKLMI
ncbi:MAG: histidine phosphatase family protein [Eubacteriales bacterium]|nr:histidine phosphatase family protein [Eubacteriales bacterium]